MFVFVEWALEHFTRLYPWSPNPDYPPQFLRANRFVPKRGHNSRSHYRGNLDHPTVEDVIFSIYVGTQGGVSSLARAGDEAVRACPRDFEASRLGGSSSFILDTPCLLGLHGSRHTVGSSGSGGTGFMNDKGGYISWFYRVSRPVMTPLVEVGDVPPPKPPNDQEFIIEEEYAKDSPNPL